MADSDLENEVLEFETDPFGLPDDNPFEEPRRHPWLLIGVGVIVVVLVLAVVLKLIIGGRSGSESGEIPIEKKGMLEQTTTPASSDDFANEADRMVAIPATEKAAIMPEREVNARKDVVFDPDKPVVQRPKPRPIVEPAKTVTSEKIVRKVVAPVKGIWMVQVGSYNTRAAAESGQRQLSSSHKSLFTGRDFVILSAVLPNGSTTYRLRVVGFQTSAEASSFCRNAQSDGVSCYVAK